MPRTHGRITLWGFVVILRFNRSSKVMLGLWHGGMWLSNAQIGTKCLFYTLWNGFCSFGSLADLHLAGRVWKIWHCIAWAGISCGSSFHTVKQSKDTPGKKPHFAQIFTVWFKRLKPQPSTGAILWQPIQCFSKAIFYFIDRLYFESLNFIYVVFAG